jgi:hypothetical protein
MCLAVSGFGSTWIVDPNGTPGVDFPDLATALTTLGAYGGSHDIVVKAADYSDANLTVPNNITSIVGEAGVVFTAPSASDNFLTISGAPSGFVISDMQIVGYTYGIQGAPTGATIMNCQFMNGGSYGVRLYNPASGNLVKDNCFIGNPGPQGFDNTAAANSWVNNFFDDVALATSYALAGGTNVDGNPAVFDNSAVAGASSYAYDEEFTVDIMWTAPACDELSPTTLAAYDFSVNFNSSKLEFVSAAYDEGFLGGSADGAGYTGVDASVAGKVQFAAFNYSMPGEGSGRLATVTFKVKAANTGSTISIGSIYKDGDNNDIVVQNTPLVLSLVDDTKPVMGPIVANDPAGDDTYSDGSTAGSGPFVEMWLQYSVTDDYDLDKLQWSKDGTTWTDYGAFTGLSGTSYTNAPGSIYLNLPVLYPGADGAYSWYVRALDAAGNISDPVQYDFNIDRTAPVLTSIVLSDPDGCAADPEWTNETDVVVTFTDDGTATDMEFYEASWQGKIGYATPYTYSFANTTDGAKTIYSRLYDKYNNMGNQVSDGITLDQTAPVVTGWTLAGGAAKTNTVNITGAVVSYGGSNVYQLNFSEDAADLVCGNSGWAALANPVNITLSAGDGVKTVYYATRDMAGNISAVVSDDIELDQTAPDFASFVVQDQTGDDCSNSFTVDVVADWTDADVKWLGLATAAGGPYSWTDVSAQTPPYTQAYAIVGGACNADNTVYGVLVDNINNYGTETSDDIFVDCTNPNVTSVEMFDVTSGNGTYSNEETVDVDIAGSVDIVEVAFSEDGSTFGTPVPVDLSSGTATLQYTFASPVTQHAWKSLWVKAWDCAGRSGTVGQDSPGIIFDLTDPVITDVTIDGGNAKTNTTAVTVAVTATEVYPKTVTLSEDPTFDTGDPTTVTYAWGGPYAFTLSTGDGVKTVYVMMDDMAGNVSAVESDDIELDMTPPSGTIDIVSTNLLAYPEYTSTASCTLDLTWDGDVSYFRVRNAGGTFSTVNPAATPQAWTITWAYGWQKVEVQFRDGAGNWGPIFYDSIFADGSVPPAPATAWGTPGGSVDLGWDPVADAQYYIVRYNYNGDYPEYGLPNPPAPGPTQGFLADGHVEGTALEFDGPQPDIYTFSIWTMGKNGVKSTAYNTDVMSTNYILGDFYDSEADAMGPDGCIDFGDEFGALAATYRTDDADALFNPYLDLGPTSTGEVTSFPVPDNTIDFTDLVIFGLNYRDYRCSGLKRALDFKPIAAGPVALTAEVPSRVQAGQEYTVTVTADNAAGIFAYHAVLDYDRDVVELVSVMPGEMYQSIDQSFFYYDEKSGNLDISSIILGNDAFAGDDMLQITFKAKASGSINLTDIELDFRDGANGAIDAGFDVAKLVEIPETFSLSQNYPNPFNPSTKINFSLPVASSYALTIYNVTGQVVHRFSGHADAGTVTVTWEAGRYSSGVYFYKLDAGNFTETRKMVLIK